MTVFTFYVGISRGPLKNGLIVQRKVSEIVGKIGKDQNAFWDIAAWIEEDKSVISFFGLFWFRSGIKAKRKVKN